MRVCLALPQHLSTPGQSEASGLPAGQRDSSGAAGEVLTLHTADLYSKLVPHDHPTTASTARERWPPHPKHSEDSQDTSQGVMEGTSKSVLPPGTQDTELAFFATPHLRQPPG